MCWDCDHPGGDFVAEVVEPNIDRYGWHVQGVQGDKRYPPSAYTVGLTLHGLPELVVTGKRLGPAAQLLNELGRQMHETGPLQHGDALVQEGTALEVVALPHPAAHLFVAVETLGPVEARQLVWADDRGRWPSETGHRAGRGGQPVLGPRAERGR